jgi:hypothetical protein
METFLMTEVPVSFIKTISSDKKIAPTKEFSCLAPWCEGYLSSGTLKRTGTLKKEFDDGHVYSFYMFCNKCGVKYSVRRKDSTLVERGYFIELVWHKVLPNLNLGLTLKDLAILLKSTPEKIRRSIIYLAANNLIKNESLPIELPSTHNPKTIESMIALLRTGLPYKQIMKNLIYPTTLFYIIYFFRLYMLNLREEKFIQLNS